MFVPGDDIDDLARDMIKEFPADAGPGHPAVQCVLRSGLCRKRQEMAAGHQRNQEDAVW